jgi:hypothetical protein
MILRNRLTIVLGIVMVLLSCNEVKQEEVKSSSLAGEGVNQPLVDSTVYKLEQLYGGETRLGQGSGVFRIATSMTAPLDSIAYGQYLQYLGSKYTAETSDAWRRGWKKVYTRVPDSARSINTTLMMIREPELAPAVKMVLDHAEPVVKGRQALGAVFNRKDINELYIYAIGDGKAIRGLLITTRYTDRSGCTLISMYDSVKE